MISRLCLFLGLAPPPALWRHLAGSGDPYGVHWGLWSTHGPIQSGCISKTPWEVQKEQLWSHTACFWPAQCVCVLLVWGSQVAWAPALPSLAGPYANTRSSMGIGLLCKPLEAYGIRILSKQWL